MDHFPAACKSIFFNIKNTFSGKMKTKTREFGNPVFVRSIFFVVSDQNYCWKFPLFITFAFPSATIFVCGFLINTSKECKNLYLPLKLSWQIFLWEFTTRVHLFRWEPVLSWYPEDSTAVTHSIQGLGGKLQAVPDQGSEDSIQGWNYTVICVRTPK